MRTARAAPLAPSVEEEAGTGPVPAARRRGRGPAIWLAGDPENRGSIAEHAVVAVHDQANGDEEP